MKKTCLLLLAGLICYGASAQDGVEHRSPQGAVYVEILGQSLAFSFNYDTRFTKSPGGIGARIGIGGWKLEDSGFLTIPVGLNYLLGKNGKYFEVGAGFAYTNSRIFDFYESDERVYRTVGTLAFGFRTQPPDGGFNFRVGITPFFGFDNGGYFWPLFGGVSFGYSFP